MGLPEPVTGTQLNEHDKYLLRYRCRLFRLAAFWARHLRSRCGLLTLDSDRIATKNDGLVLGGFCRADCGPPDRQSFRCYQSAVVLVLVAGGLAGFSSSYPNIGESV